MTFNEYKYSFDRDTIVEKIAQEVANIVTERVKNDSICDLSIFERFLKQECKCTEVIVPGIAILGQHCFISFKPPINWIKEINIMLDSGNYEEFLVESAILKEDNKYNNDCSNYDLYSFYENHFKEKEEESQK